MGLFRTKFSSKSAIKLTSIQQNLFIQLLADLMNNGFTLQESFLFMEKSHTIKKETIQFLNSQLAAGNPLDQIMLVLGFSQQIAVQIAFATIHGDLKNTLTEIYHYLIEVQKQRQSFFKVLSYPLLLLFFLVIVIFSIRQFLLPQLMMTNSDMETNLGLAVIENSPYILLGIVGFILVLFICVRGYLLKKSALQRSFFYMKVPLLRQLYSEYISAFFALEWGKLFSQGLETKAVIHLMKQTQSHRLMAELALSLEESLLAGETLYQQLLDYPFFTKELSLIIQRGEVKGKLGKELTLYSKISLTQFFKKIEKIITWIQPVVFITIAMLVIGVYGAMLLPIYGNMEGVLN
jgi:competence protein ComGB